MSIWKRGPKRYLVRVEPYRARTVHGSRADAEKVELELKRKKTMGEHYEAPASLLAAELDGWLERIFATRKLSDRTREWYTRARHGWDGLGHVRVCDLTRTMVEDRTAARAADTAKSAADELMILKQCLGEAKARGQRVDPAIFTIPPVKHRPRRGRALTVAQLYDFSSWFGESQRRLPLLAGQIGARLSFWLNLTDDMLDLDAGTMLAPAELQKNRCEHLVYLTDVEKQLFREQLLARAAGTRLVFPTPTGRQWRRYTYRNRAWLPAVEAAARTDPTGVFGRFEKQPDGGEKLVEPFTFHWLRHTAGSLMALSGMDAPVAAERMGHTDGGALFLRTYRHLYEGERRRNADKLGALVRSALDHSGSAQEAEA